MVLKRTSNPASFNFSVRNRELVSWKYGVSNSDPTAIISAFIPAETLRDSLRLRVFVVDFSLPRNTRRHQEDYLKDEVGVNSCEQVVCHDSHAIPQKLEFAHRVRLPYVKHAEKKRAQQQVQERSEERRVGKECRSGW